MKKIIFLILVSIIAIIVICFVIILFGFNTLRFHPVYTLAMEIITSDPEVVTIFGSPIKGGIFVLGTTRKYIYDGSTVSMDTPIIGPKTRGIVSIFGTQSEKGSAWRIDSMTIRVNGEIILVYSGSQTEKGFQLYQSQNQIDTNMSAPTPPSK
jgi:hypothetical protein